ncbi:MAG: outer membrane lipoprotein-sorting protein, partial [Candidatus Binatia bacterium]
AVSYTEQWGPLDEPADLRGAGILNFRYIDANVPDDTYMYLPALRKVRRLSVANRSDSFWGTDIDIDSIWCFNAKIPFWSFRVLAEKQILHPFHAGGYGRRDAWCAQPDGASGPKSFAFCLPWELRPIVIVEGTPTGYNQYAYSKRIAYIDKEWLSCSFSEAYDHGGQIWKAWYMALDVGKRPGGEGMVGGPAWEEERIVATHGGMVDFQLNHVSKWDAPDAYLWPDFGVKHWYVDEPREWNTPENFSVNYLISSGSF